METYPHGYFALAKYIGEQLKSIQKEIFSAIFLNFITNLKTAIQKDIYYANYFQTPILTIPDSREKNFENFIEVAYSLKIDPNDQWTVIY